MHSFLWGTLHPDFMDGLMPLACLPVPVVGRNRLWRQMIIDSIHADPAWQGGDYQEQPQAGLRAAAYLWAIAASAPTQLQINQATPAAVDKFKDELLQRELAAIDANDLIYQVDASRDYDPSAKLGLIKRPVQWVNSEDDFINPPFLGIAELEVKRLARGHFRLVPAGDHSYGHGSYNYAEIWQGDLAALLKETAR